MASEAVITNKCRILFQALAKEHKDFFFQKISDRFASGIPDYYILYRGTSIWIELKAEGKKPIMVQYHYLNKLKKAGAITMWTSNFEDVKRLMSKIINQDHDYLKEIH